MLITSLFHFCSLVLVILFCMAYSVSSLVSQSSSTSGTLTVIGFGSLMSEESSRGTFPKLRNFRYARVEGWRRVMRHPASIFFERGIANLETKEMSSLSAEPYEGEGFVVCVFDVDQPSQEEMEEFRKREEEFELVPASFTELDSGITGSGLICSASTDAAFIERWGQDTFDAKYVSYGIHSIWDDWGTDSGIRPCPVYLRHCVLATSKEGVDSRARDSFLDETFLADRKTTVRRYLESDLGAHVMRSEPPQSLIGRYSG